MGEFKPYPKAPRTEKRTRIPMGKVSVKRKYKEPTGELEVFKMIIKERGSMSQIGGDPIYNPTVSNMIHILAKGQNKYPKFILYKKNIIIGTQEEHDEYDFGSHEKLRKNPKWDWVFALRDELLIEYKQKHG